MQTTAKRKMLVFTMHFYLGDTLKQITVILALGRFAY